MWLCVKQDVRTPLSNLVAVGHVARQCRGLTLLLLPLLPHSLQAIPQVATAPVLVLVAAACRVARHICKLTLLLLLPLLPYSLQAIPQVATAPVLVLVGAMMMGESTHIDWSSMLTAIPAFLTIVIQPFTFSIANGIYAGVDCSRSAGAAAVSAAAAAGSQGAWVLFPASAQCNPAWRALHDCSWRQPCICSCCTCIGTAAPTAPASLTILLN